MGLQRGVGCHCWVKRAVRNASRWHKVVAAVGWLVGHGLAADHGRDNLGLFSGQWGEHSRLWKTAEWVFLKQHTKVSVATFLHVVATLFYPFWLPLRWWEAVGIFFNQLWFIPLLRFVAMHYHVTILCAIKQDCSFCCNIFLILSLKQFRPF